MNKDNNKPIISSQMAQKEWEKTNTGCAGDTIFSARMLIYLAVLMERLLKKPPKIINITIFGKK